MKAVMTALVIGLVLAAPAATHDRERDEDRGCSTRTIAGSWLFASDIGEVAGVGHMTAIGTLNVDREGNISGKFDVTLGQIAFLSDTYSGSIKVNPDCTAVGTFTTSDGSGRTDSMVILDGEIWGMSQDPSTLLTFRAKRISKRPVSVGLD